MAVLKLSSETPSRDFSPVFFSYLRARGVGGNISSVFPVVWCSSLSCSRGTTHFTSPHHFLRLTRTNEFSRAAEPSREPEPGAAASVVDTVVDVVRGWREFLLVGFFFLRVL